MSTVLISYSPDDIAHAIALQKWLAERGWQHVFELPSQTSIDSGMTWERALYQAGHYCEAVVFLVSRSWLTSGMCLEQFRIAEHLNKRLFAGLIEGLTISDIPRHITDVTEFLSLSFAPNYKDFFVVPPGTQNGTLVRFSADGLRQLELALQLAGLAAKNFQWPPWDQPDRPADRGCEIFEENDAGIFFGREQEIGNALDLLRGLRKAPCPRLLVIRGDRGVGKSSFLRAGLLPRLARDDRNFWVLPVVRPDQAAINGKTGFIASIENAMRACQLDKTPDAPKRTLRNGGATFRRLLDELAGKRLAQRIEHGWPYPAHMDAPRGLPLVISCIDQGEELLSDAGRDEAQILLALLRDLIIEDFPPVAVIIAICPELYPRLLETTLLKELELTIFDLEPL